LKVGTNSRKKLHFLVQGGDGQFLRELLLLLASLALDNFISAAGQKTNLVFITPAFTASSGTSAVSRLVCTDAGVEKISNL